MRPRARHSNLMAPCPKRILREVCALALRHTDGVRPEQEFRRAIELNTNLACTALPLRLYRARFPQKRFDQALEEFRLALSLDPPFLHN